MAQAAVTEHWPKKAEKTAEKTAFFRKKIKFTQSGSKAKYGGKEERRPKVGDNNGQGTNGARNHAWRTQATWAKKVVENKSQLRIHGSRLEQQISAAKILK